MKKDVFLHEMKKSRSIANCATDRTVLRSKTDAEQSERTL